MVNLLATRVPELRADAPFHGAPTEAAQVGRIKAELMLALAENDERINAAWRTYEAALKSAGLTFEAFK